MQEMSLNALKTGNYDSRKSLASQGTQGRGSIKGFGANRSTYGSQSDKDNNNLSLIDLQGQPGIRLLKYIQSESFGDFGESQKMF